MALLVGVTISCAQEIQPPDGVKTETEKFNPDFFIKSLTEKYSQYIAACSSSSKHTPTEIKNIYTIIDDLILLCDTSKNQLGLEQLKYPENSIKYKALEIERNSVAGFFNLAHRIKTAPLDSQFPLDYANALPENQFKALYLSLQSIPDACATEYYNEPDFIEALQNVRIPFAISINSSQLSDERFSDLTKITNIRFLCIYDTVGLTLDEKSCARLAGFKQLWGIRIEDNNVALLTQLKKLDSLSYIYLLSPDNHEALKELNGMNSLRILYIWNTLPEYGIDKLIDLPNLNMLILNGYLGKGTSNLARFPRLKTLYLYECYGLKPEFLFSRESVSNSSITSLQIVGCPGIFKNLGYFNGMPNLQTLFLEYSEDAFFVVVESNNNSLGVEIQSINNLPSLRSLDISFAHKMSNDTIRHFASFPLLNSLSLYNCPVQKCSFLELKCRNLHTLYLDGTNITSEQLEQIFNTTSVSALYLRDCEITDENAIRISRLHPDCAICNQEDKVLINGKEIVSPPKYEGGMF